MRNWKKILMAVIWLGVFAFNVSGVWADAATTTGKSPILPDCVSSNDINQLFSEECRSINTFVEMAINIGAFAFSIIGAVALGALVYGGFMLVISGGNSERVKKGGDALFAAAIGLGITFSGYILVSFVIKALGGSESGFSLIK